MSATLIRDIDELSDRLRVMGQCAELRVQTALEAWWTWDTDLAAAIKAADDEIDRMDINIDSECVRIIAQHQPVASDLRLILATMRINTSLERMADLARSIAKRVLRLSENGPKVDPPETAKTMGDAVLEMVSGCMKAYAERDIELARYVRKSDIFVDQRNRELYTWAMESAAEQPALARGFVETLTMTRTLERIGDLSANIAEDVIFAVGGSIVRHTPI